MTGDKVEVRITSFEPLTMELPAGSVCGPVTLVLPPLHLQVYDLSLGGLLPGAHIGGDIPIVGLTFDTGAAGLTPGKLADFVSAAREELRAIWQAYQDEFDKRGALL